MQDAAATMSGNQTKGPQKTSPANHEFLTTPPPPPALVPDFPGGGGGEHLHGSIELWISLK